MNTSSQMNAPVPDTRKGAPRPQQSAKDTPRGQQAGGDSTSGQMNGTPLGDWASI